ncbi:MAG: 50S ribosomal protein L11 methyltransferase [Acidisphaera sp.]|nr:50S ribosomal protein L11 methyltransferase [Acidisphaera sp.]
MACGTVGFFRHDRSGEWRVEGVKEPGEREAALADGLALAATASGFAAKLVRRRIPAEGWLARTQAAFPEQRIGRFILRGTHLPERSEPGRITLLLDAGVAFGSGEHGSTRGCLRALERVAHRRPVRVLDLGTGSGVLAMAAARLLRRPVLGVDIEPWSVRTASDNAARNRLRPRLRCILADGWRHRAVRMAGPFDLVFANILARPLCAMARDLARGLAPGGTAILAGLLGAQMRLVLAAHRRQGLRLEQVVCEQGWTTLVLRKPAKPELCPAR